MLHRTTDSFAWPRYPSVLEINAWVWLSHLSEKCGRIVRLASVPASEWDEIARTGCDAVWLMGVWERSPAGIAVANRNHSLLESFRLALPDFVPSDNVGSPYCVRRYVVDDHLGGGDGLAVARSELSSRGVRLIVDFVPNHVAPDHPWVAEHPEYFIAGTAGDLANDSASWFQSGHGVFACGKDPYFPAWPDVLQLNAFHPGVRQAAADTLLDIARQSDGVRCDMAMLMVNHVFERTWARRAGQPPPSDYWLDIIPAIKGANPNFRFFAEAYWGMEWELQQQGFDFCYDKTLYDRLEHNDAETVRLHLCADLAYQDKLVRFIENHDEPRAAATFHEARHRAAAVTTATLPGAKLFHQGQFEGRKVKLPVFLGRGPQEPVDESIRSFYRKLLDSINSPVFREGEWNLCERSGWPDNSSFLNMVAWSWSKGNRWYLIVVNLSDTVSQARIRLPWPGLREQTVRLEDVLSGDRYDRNGDEMDREGMYVELRPWAYHFFRCQYQNERAVRAAA
jgi:hypothetical protein